ncbi:MAG: aldo/keto reductase [Armatimonadota bacterium]
MLEKRALGTTGVQATFIGFGALEIGRDWGLGDAKQRLRPTEQEAGRTLNAVIDLGINLIDTARAYHESEARIGKYISYRRAEYVLCSKCGEHSDDPRTYYDFSYRAVADSIDLSLRLLRTDVIDVMQIHFGPNSQKVLDDGETLQAMREAQQAGKVRFLGASPGMDMLERCIESGDFQVLQIGYSLLEQDAHDLITRAHEKGIGVLIRSGLAAGWLTPRVRTVPPNQRPPKVQKLLDLCQGDADLLHALALHFLHRHPGISSVLIGTRRAANLQRNIELLRQPVDDALLQEATAIGREAG